MIMLKENLLVQVLDGTLTDYKKHATGVYKNFYICIDFKEPFYFTRINAILSSETKEQLTIFLTDAKKELRHLKSFELKDNEVLLAIVQPNFKKNVPSILNSVIGPIVNFLSENHYISGCGKCGSEEPLYCKEIQKQHHLYCEGCILFAEENTQKKQRRFFF